MKPGDLAKKSLTPLVALSGAAMLGAGIWLLLLGIWRPMWPVLLGTFSCYLVFRIFLIPMAFFIGVMNVATAAGMRKVSVFMQILTLGWLAMVMSGWTGFVMAMMAVPFHGTEAHAPALIWFCAASVFAWGAFATRDRDNVIFTGFVLMLAAAVLLAAAAVSFWGLAPYLMPVAKFVFVAIVSMMAVQSVVETFVLRHKPPIPAAVPGVEEALPEKPDEKESGGKPSAP